MAKMCKYWNGDCHLIKCPKNTDRHCQIIPKRKSKVRRVEAWAIVRDEHEIEAITPQPKHFKNAYVPCTILIDEKYLKEAK